ncbi:oligosaccharide flippase family protein [Chlorobium limicola]
MDESIVKRKIIKGSAFLLIRQVIVQGFNISGAILLARIISQSEYGFFGIITFLSSFLTSFGDVGLGASLVREKIEPSDKDYNAVFSVQFILVFCVLILFLISSQFLSLLYNLGDNGIIVFGLLGFSFILSSLMAIPVIKMERRLQFNRIASVEVFQVIAFNVGAVYFAWKQIGLISFAYALVIRGIIGVIGVYMFTHWRPRFCFDFSVVKNRIIFGINYQGVKIVSLLKDSVTPIFIGIYVNTDAVGYINWAGMIAAYPVMLLFVLQRVYMPAFSRLQSDVAALGKIMENVVWSTNAITAPLAIITMILIHPITVIVFGEKWIHAIPLFQCFWLANIFVPTTTPSMGILDAMGYSKINLRFAIIWMLGNWIIGVPFIYIWGIIGFAYANIVIQLSNILLYKAAQNVVPYKIIINVIPLWFVSVLTGVIMYFLFKYYPIVKFSDLIIYTVSFLSLYLLIVFIFYKERVLVGFKILFG